jgi:hypothetical protein
VAYPRTQKFYQSVHFYTVSGKVPGAHSVTGNRTKTNRTEAAGRKPRLNNHRETTAPAPVLDSTRHYANNSRCSRCRTIGTLPVYRRSLACGFKLSHSPPHGII